MTLDIPPYMMEDHELLEDDEMMDHGDVQLNNEMDPSTQIHVAAEEDIENLPQVENKFCPLSKNRVDDGTMGEPLKIAFLTMGGCLSYGWFSAKANGCFASFFWYLRPLSLFLWPLPHTMEDGWFVNTAWAPRLFKNRFRQENEKEWTNLVAF